MQNQIAKEKTISGRLQHLLQLGVVAVPHIIHGGLRLIGHACMGLPGICGRKWRAIGGEVCTHHFCWPVNIPTEGRRLEIYNGMQTSTEIIGFIQSKSGKPAQCTYRFLGLFVLHTSAWPLQKHRPPMLISFML